MVQRLHPGGHHQGQVTGNPLRRRYSWSVLGALHIFFLNSCIFFFLSSGSEDASQSFLALLDQANVSQSLGNTIAIKLESGSESCQQFSAIYPVVIIPSLYFIDSGSGVNLEVTGGSDLTEEKVMASIEKVRGHIKVAAGEDVASPRGQRVEQASNVLEAASGPSTSSSASEDKGQGQQQLSLDERVARAKRLLAERQQQKEEEDEEVRSHFVRCFLQIFHLHRSFFRK